MPSLLLFKTLRVYNKVSHSFVPLFHMLTAHEGLDRIEELYNSGDILLH